MIRLMSKKREAQYLSPKMNGSIFCFSVPVEKHSIKNAGVSGRHESARTKQD